MPIYEYQCKKCGEFETVQKITEPPLKRCPTCRGKVTKLISNTSFHLKGTGWYITDYGRKDGKSKDSGSSSSSSESKDSKAEKSSSASDTKSSDSKSSDSKPAKSDTKASGSKEAAAA
jgi:putative FmdB family regulatory protein